MTGQLDICSFSIASRLLLRRVANELGAGDGNAASRAAKVAVALTACIVAVLSWLLIGFRYDPPSILAAVIRCRA